MSASAMPQLLRFLNLNGISWFPIADMKLDARGKKVFDPKLNKELLGYIPTTTDFANLGEDVIKTRQKKYTKTNTIAIDTSKYGILDCDTEDIPEEIMAVVKIAPYFKSYSKGLPKAFMNIENVVSKANTKTVFNEIEIQTGQWSYAKLDCVIENFGQPIPSVDISKWILKKTKDDDVKRLLYKLSEHRVEERNKWWAVGVVVKTEIGEDGWTLFDEWSKLSGKKYDKENNKKIWDEIQPKSSMNVTVLKKWIKEDTKKEIGEDEEQEYDVSHKGIAELFIKHFSNVLGSNKAIYKFANHRWHEISASALKSMLLVDFMRLVGKLLAECVSENEKDYYVTVIKTLSITKELKYVFEMVSVLINDDDAYDKFDSNTHLVCFDNGVFDLSTCEFRDGKPTDYITFSTGYQYLDVDKAKMDIWNNMLNDIFPDRDVSHYYKCIMAYSLSGNKKFEEFYIHKGQGGNGKGLLGEFMDNVFGKYASKMSAGMLTIAAKNKNEASPELANKKGKRYVLATELPEGAELQMGAIKQWTGGDKITTRALYKDAFEFNPQFSLHIQTNDLPEIKKIDDSIRRRVRVIDYPVKFCSNPDPNNANEKQSDPHLKTMIQEDPELWNAAVHDLFDVFKNIKDAKCIEMPSECHKHTTKYLNDNDKIKQWFDDNVFAAKGKRVKPRELYTNYVNWTSKDPKRLTETAFGTTMVERFKLIKKKYQGTIMYYDISLSLPNEEDEYDEDDEEDE